MSGGHFSFSYIHVSGDLDEIAHDEEVMRRWPRLAQALINLGQRLEPIIKEIDYDLCGDGAIENDEGFELMALQWLARTIREVDQ